MTKMSQMGPKRSEWAGAAGFGPAGPGARRPGAKDRQGGPKGRQAGPKDHQVGPNDHQGVPKVAKRCSSIALGNPRIAKRCARNTQRGPRTAKRGRQRLRGVTTCWDVPDSSSTVSGRVDLCKQLDLGLFVRTFNISGPG